MDFTLTLNGTEPLIMHSAALANPLSPQAKALKKVTSKRQKTDEDHEEIARLDWLGGLYFDERLGPFIPGQNIERALWDAAKQTKQGPKIQRGVFVTSNVNPLLYKGPRDIDGLWKDENFRHVASVKVQMSRTMRCRPYFREWQVQFEGRLDPNIIDPENLADIAETAGQTVGLGDWRPRFGRFTADLEWEG